VDWSLPFIQSFREYGPYVAMGFASALISMTGVAWKLLSRDTWHFSKQCVEARTIQKDRYVEAKDQIAELKSENERQRGLLYQGIGTVVRNSETVERLVNVTVPAAAAAHNPGAGTESG
jgi:hypothetical protein